MTNTFTKKQSIQPLFLYSDRSIESILTYAEKQLKNSNISIESLEPYIFEDVDKSHRLSHQDKAAIYNKLDRIISYYTSSPGHLVGSRIITTHQRKLSFFQLEQVQPVMVDRDSEEVLRKSINNYRNDVHKIYVEKEVAEPFYCLNHFINRDKLIQIKDRTGLRALNVHLWNFDFEAALDCLSRKMGENVDSTDIQILTSIIRIFKNTTMLTLRDEDLKRRFHQRKASNIDVVRQLRNYDVSIPHNLLSGDLTYEELTQVTSLPTGAQSYFLKKILDYAISLASNFAEMASASDPEREGSCQIPYLFLANNLQTSNYGVILQSEQLNEVDKFFFAYRFLNSKKFSEYIQSLWKRLEVSYNLLEIALCPSLKYQAQIMQNYIDETGNNRTIAVLALYEKLKLEDNSQEEMDFFIEKYKNMLTEFNQQDQLEEFERKLNDIYEKEKPLKGLRKTSLQSNVDQDLGEPFLCRIDPQAQKIRPSAPRRDYHKFCWICRTPTYDAYQKTKGVRQDFYAECDKCKHGGHLKHMAVWFENNIRCPVPDCSCSCN